MAISWNVKITVLDVATKSVSVTATRTDSELPNDIRTYSVLSAIIVTPVQKLAVLDNIWLQHQVAITKQTTINAFIGALEADAKENLEARET